MESETRWLFQHDDGESMQFAIHESVGDRDRLVQSIELNRGIIVEKMDLADFCLFPSSSNVHFASQVEERGSVALVFWWIRDCIDAEHLLPWYPYYIGNDKNSHLPSEERDLQEFISIIAVCQSLIKPARLYETISKKYPHRTRFQWEELHQKYIERIKPRAAQLQERYQELCQSTVIQFQSQLRFSKPREVIIRIQETPLSMEPNSIDDTTLISNREDESGVQTLVSNEESRMKPPVRSTQGKEPAEPLAQEEGVTEPTIESTSSPLSQAPDENPSPPPRKPHWRPFNSADFDFFVAFWLENEQLPSPIFWKKMADDERAPSTRSHHAWSRFYLNKKTQLSAAIEAGRPVPPKETEDAIENPSSTTEPTHSSTSNTNTFGQGKTTSFMSTDTQMEASSSMDKSSSLSYSRKRRRKDENTVEAESSIHRPVGRPRKVWTRSTPFTEVDEEFMLDFFVKYQDMSTSSLRDWATLTRMKNAPKHSAASWYQYYRKHYRRFQSEILKRTMEARMIEDHDNTPPNAPTSYQSSVLSEAPEETVEPIDISRDLALTEVQVDIFQAVHMNRCSAKSIPVDQVWKLFAEQHEWLRSSAATWGLRYTQRRELIEQLRGFFPNMDTAMEAMASNQGGDIPKDLTARYTNEDLEAMARYVSDPPTEASFAFPDGWEIFADKFSKGRLITKASWCAHYMWRIREIHLRAKEMSLKKHGSPIVSSASSMSISA